MTSETTVYLGKTLLASAAASEIEKVEGNLYFKEAAVKDRERYSKSDTKYHCPWKGDCQYFTYTAEDGKEYKDFAWTYPKPLPGAEMVDGRWAFYARKYPEIKVGQ